MHHLSRRDMLLSTSLIALGAPAFGGVWNQWRGPTRDGISTGTTPWPDALQNDHLSEIWRVDLSPSYSGPIVEDGRVFVTETVDAAKETTAAYSISDGERLWRAEWEGAMSVPFFARANGSWIRSTPAVAGGKLLVGGMRDVLVCLDTETGKELWRNDFAASLNSALPSFGFVCSPLVDEHHAYLQAGGGLLKLDIETGQILWRVLDDGGGMSGGAFSSPVMAVIAGQRQIVVQTRTQLAGVDPNDGSTLWSIEVPAFRGMNILTPTVVGDAVFTSSYGGGSFCHDIEANENGFAVRERWSNRVQAYMSSPIVFEGHVYLHLRNQRCTCLNLENGEQRWSSRPFGKYWSMVCQDRKILALDERGELLLMQPNPAEFMLLDQRSVASDAWAHLAIADDLLLVRDLNALVVYRWT